MNKNKKKFSSTFKIASFPARGNPNNPYVDLFYDALELYEIELVDELKIDIDWLRANGNRLDGIHFHWPDFFWKYYIPVEKHIIRKFFVTRVSGAWRLFKSIDYVKSTSWYQKKQSLINKFKGVLYLYKFLKLARKLGLTIIWTFHNSESHEGDDLIDRIGYHLMIRLSNIIIFHSQLSKQECIDFYKPKAKLIYMPHGNYSGVYPPAHSRKVILDKLGLREDLPVVSCLGMLRDYKGVDIASEAVALLNGTVQLICAGKPHQTFDIDRLRIQIELIPGAVLVPRFITEQEFSDFASASDIILLPYRKITGSGALLAALTFSRGVVVSDIPYFREILGTNSDAGVLVESCNPQALANGIQEYLAISTKRRNQAAKHLSEQYDWDKVIVNVVNALKNEKNNSEEIL